MKKILLLALLLVASKNHAQECVDRVVCSDNSVTVYLLDGNTLTWGQNQFGQLGNGTTVATISPTPTVNADQWASVSHARMHTIALDHDGNLWSWGNNDVGQLGNNSTASYSYVPVSTGSGSDWIEISGGNLHSIGKKADGTLWGWGNNGAYELIMNGENFYANPFQISPDTDWNKIYAGYFKTFAIKYDGTLWGRGRNNLGDVGIGSTVWVPFFTQIGTANNWTKISAARCNSSFGLRSDNTLWAWGINENGRLGDGTVINRTAPVQIPGQWKDIASGNFHTIGIKTDGTLWQWGSYGWFDGGIPIPITNVPVQVGTDSDWKSVSAGYCSSYAIKENNSLWSWGYNGGGWLGDGTTVSNYTPEMIMGCTQMSSSDWLSGALTVYPNPTRDIVKWNTTETMSTFRIVNALGQTVKSGDARSGELHVSDLTEGIYVIVLESSSGKTQQTKFIKQ
ncbi:MAG: T9SS type A sorting domain-containing protein [Flavobacterium sp.]|uniref:T9SS type A sorting domain-containing protein n=1 Tax=Flavobacterium sp. TaxID=239 RepID=UPI00121948AB|nr:T9SS type A sorting domain-containing protein [Flavobacterium sp.]RZJ66171.1 MAG: T9SS type A sorting domain-containing protein [Flavobacterium sp.]